MKQITKILTLLAIFVLSIGCKKDPVPETPESEYPTSIAKPELTVFEAPSGAPKNFSYSVYVKYDGGDWIDLFEYNAGVDGGYGSTPLGNMGFVSFDSDYSKTIDVKVIKKSGSVKDVKIRPASAGIIPSVNGSTIEFSISKASKLSVEINGDLLNNLMVFANNLETDVPDPNDPNVHYFGPGIHKLGGDGKGNLLITNSNEKVYIAGGAIVYGSIYVGNASYVPISNITISGRGILSGSMYTNHTYPHAGEAKGSLLLNVVKDSKVEGITILNTVAWNIHMNVCRNIEVKNIKAMGWTINSDGIDPQSSNDILIDDCFVRNHDDCVSIKLSWFEGGIQPYGCKNVTVQNCVFWTDQGRAMLIGPESASSSNKVFEDITFKNIDVLYAENYDGTGLDWAKGVMSINAGDDVTVRNITFEDIRVEKLGSKTNLIALNMVKNQYSGSEGKRIENVHFNNISLDSKISYSNHILGIDETRMVSGIYFQDLMIDGLYIDNAIDGKFNLNEFTERIEFTTSN